LTRIKQIFYSLSAIKTTFLWAIERSSRKSQKGFSNTGNQIRGRLYVYPVRLTSHL